MLQTRQVPEGSWGQGREQPQGTALDSSTHQAGGDTDPCMDTSVHRALMSGPEVLGSERTVASQVLTSFSNCAKLP